MSARTHVAAVDLGAESGRVASVAFDGERLDLQVAHRFTHQPHEVDGIVRWDLDSLWGGVREGWPGSPAESTTSPRSASTPGASTTACSTPPATSSTSPPATATTRQPRARAAVLAEVGADRIYSATGVQVIDINTIFALVSDAREHPERLERAATLLMMPDVLHHMLSGSRVTEHTAASTTGFYDTGAERWTTELLDQLGVPTPAAAGRPARHDVGALLPQLATRPPGRRPRRRPAGPRHRQRRGRHAAARPRQPLHLQRHLVARRRRGRRPRRLPRTRAANMTNEGGYAGTVRLLRNVTGLWVLQSCRRWCSARAPSCPTPSWSSWPPASRPARHRQPRRPGVPRRPPHPRAHRAVLRADGHPGPAGRRRDHPRRPRLPRPGLPARRRGPRRDHRPARAQRQRRRRRREQHAALAADRRRCGVPVFCGPVEATALGNAATQLAALGELGDLHDIRRVVAATEPVTPYAPGPARPGTPPLSTSPASSPATASGRASASPPPAEPARRTRSTVSTPAPPLRSTTLPAAVPAQQGDSPMTSTKFTTTARTAALVVVAGALVLSGCTKKNDTAGGSAGSGGGSGSTAAAGGSGGASDVKVAFVPKLQGIPTSRR